MLKDLANKIEAAAREVEPMYLVKRLRTLARAEVLNKTFWRVDPPRAPTVTITAVDPRGNVSGLGFHASLAMAAERLYNTELEALQELREAQNREVMRHERNARDCRARELATLRRIGGIVNDG